MSAEAEIKQFIDRILRLKEEQDTLGEDIREVYAEAKGMGYDKTVLGNVVSHLRKVAKLGNDTLSEREAIFDLYLTAYETGGRAPASARTRENIEEFPVDARLVATVANAVQTETGRKALIAAVDIMIEREESYDPETGEIHERPSTDDESSPEAGPQAQASHAGTGTGTLADREGRSEGEAVSADLPTNSRGKASDGTDQSSVRNPDGPVVAANAGGDDVDGSAARASTQNEVEVAGPVNEASTSTSNFEPPAFLVKKTMRDYRPHCQNPDACAASGLKHCYSCSKLMAVESEVA